jgi:hypothetical protein
MAHNKRFQCPYCQAIFAVEPLKKRFACPRCGHTFATVRMDRLERGWIALPQMAWQQAHSQVVRPFPGRGELHAAGAPDERPAQSRMAEAAGRDTRLPGAARQRREGRRKRRRAALPMAIIALVAVCAAVLLHPPGAMGREAGLAGVDGGRIETGKGVDSIDKGVDSIDPYGNPVRSAMPTASPTPLATASATTTPTPTATPTPLPPALLQATAWQATLDQAAAASHATQTLVADNYAATQTALPPTLTAMAQDRYATATQKAAEATKRAAGPATR